MLRWLHLRTQPPAIGKGEIMFPLWLLARIGQPTCFCTEKGAVPKTVRCEACNLKYSYLLSREASVPARDWWGKAAQQQASDDLRKLLARGCDPVPCPKCGWYQRDMVKRVRHLRYRTLLLATVLPFIVWFVLSCWVIILLEATAGSLVIRFFWYMALVSSAGCLLLGFPLAWLLNPNRGDAASRIRLGRSRARIESRGFSWPVF
jgi:hypothetical protein